MPSPNMFANANVEPDGSTRGDDDRFHDLFKIVRINSPALYGDYIYSFLDNGYDFNIEIGAFGYPDYRHLGSPDPSKRQQFSAEEAATAEQLIRSFFLSSPSIYRERSLNARFVGGVTFRPNWIVVKPPERN